jgi:hypothetical protein
MMAKRGKTAAKKPTKKSTKPRAKRAAAGQKRTSAGAGARTAPPPQMSFIDHFLSIFAEPKTRKT